MSRKSRNEKPLIIATQEAFEKHKTLTPSELAQYAGFELHYASKHVSWLRRLGHIITANREGKTVVSYTYGGPCAPRVKASAAVAAPVSKAEERRTAAAAKAIKVAKPSKPVKIKDEVEATFGSSGAAASYSVDPDWDAVEDVKSLL